jgi:hypothetical protein
MMHGQTNIKLLGVYELLLLQLHFLCLHMCGVNLNKDRMWYYMHWVIRGAPFDIFYILGVCHKIFNTSLPI